MNKSLYWVLVLAGIFTAQAFAQLNQVMLRYIPGSTVKLEQLIGDFDKQKKAPTLNQTMSRYRIQGTDLGYSFEHKGKLIILFGDTLGRGGGDAMAHSSTVDPERGLRLDFFTDRRGNYLKVEPPGISMKGFEVPVAGISNDGKMYVTIKTNHSRESHTDISLLTLFDEDKQEFKVLREISRLPEGRFVEVSLRHEPEPIAGLPEGSPYILIWGSGIYRQSHAFLSIVPRHELETGKGTLYFAGMGQDGRPIWSAKEADAKPVVEHPTIGEFSVTWVAPLKLWLMTYQSRQPRGVMMRYSHTPWGPWSDFQTMLDREGHGQFIHMVSSERDDGLAGPVIGAGRDNPQKVPGGPYAPYVIERFTKVEANKLTIYYVLSTWNPYVVVLMRSQFEVKGFR